MNSGMLRSSRAPAGLVPATASPLRRAAPHMGRIPNLAAAAPERSALVRDDDPAAEGGGHRPRPRGLPELAQHRRHVVAHGLLRQVQAGGHVGVGQPVGEQPQHLELAPGELRGVGPRLRPRLARHRQLAGVPVAQHGLPDGGRAEAVGDLEGPPSVGHVGRGGQRQRRPERAAQRLPGLRRLVPGAVEQQRERAGDRDRACPGGHPATASHQDSSPSAQAIGMGHRRGPGAVDLCRHLVGAAGDPGALRSGHRHRDEALLLARPLGQGPGRGEMPGIDSLAAQREDPGDRLDGDPRDRRQLRPAERTPGVLLRGAVPTLLGLRAGQPAGHVDAPGVQIAFVAVRQPGPQHAVAVGETAG